MRPIVLIALVAVVLAGGLLWLVASEGSGETPVENTALRPDRGGDERASEPPPVEPDTPTSATRTAKGPDTIERTAHGGTRRDVEPAPRVVVSGRLVDDRGRGVGARVLLGPSDRSSSLPVDASTRAGAVVEGASDATGYFSIELEPRPGRYGLAIRAPGFADVDRHGLVLPPEGEHSVGVIGLDRGVIVQGKVLDDLGKPVGGASVHRGFRADDGSLVRGGLLTLSGIHGDFATNTLPAGPLVLIAEKEGYQRGAFEGLTSQPGERLRDAEITLRTGAGVAGRVIDSAGRPVPGTTVVALDGPRDRAIASVEVMADGTFGLGGLPLERSVFLRARATELPERPARWLTEPVEFRPGDRTAELVVQPAAGVVLTVVETKDGAPVVPEALVVRARSGGDAVLVEEVELRNPEEWQEREDGSLLVTRLPWTFGAGEVAVTIEAFLRGRTASSQPFRPRPGSEFEVGDLVLGGEGSVSVLVVDALTGEGVPDARVHLEPWASPGEDQRLVQRDYGLAPAGTQTKTTDNAGFARVAGPRGRRCRLWADHPDHSPSADLEVQIGSIPVEPIQLELTEPTGAIAVVVDGKGARVPGRVVRQMFLRPGETVPVSFRSAASDGEGIARFPGLRPGSHRFTLEHESDAERQAFLVHNPSAGPDGSIPLAIRSGTTTEVWLVAPAIVSLSGRVTLSGAPLAGATVRLYGDRAEALDAEAGFSAPSELETVSDGTGRYRFEGLVAGEYTITVSHATQAMPQHFTVPVVEVNTTCNLPLEVFVVAGRVTTPDGAPVAEARVRVERVAGEDQDELPDWLAAGALGSARTGTMPAEAVTDADGRFEIVGVDRSTGLTLVAEGGWLVSARSDPFGFAEGETRVFVEVAASIGGAIRAQVESSTGGRVDLFQLMAHPLGVVAPEVGRRTSAFSDEDGGLAIEGVHPARYRVECGKMFGASSLEPVEIEVLAGEAVDLVFRVD